MFCLGRQGVQSVKLTRALKSLLLSTPCIRRSTPASWGIAAFAMIDLDAFIRLHVTPSAPPSAPLPGPVNLDSFVRRPAPPRALGPYGNDYWVRLNLRILMAHPAPPAVVKAILGPGSLLQEEMLLAPFLDTGDLLDLSEAAPWLEPYRNQLAEILVMRARHSRATAVLHMQRRLHTIRLGGCHTRGPLVRQHAVFRGDGWEVHSGRYDVVCWSLTCACGF
jgi:hypothetical protein